MAPPRHASLLRLCFLHRVLCSPLFSQPPTHPQFYKNNKKKSFSSFFFRLIICIFVIIYLNRKQFSECQTRNFTCFLQMCRIFYFIYIFFYPGGRNQPFCEIVVGSNFLWIVVRYTSVPALSKYVSIFFPLDFGLTGNSPCVFSHSSC